MDARDLQLLALVGRSRQVAIHLMPRVRQGLHGLGMPELDEESVEAVDPRIPVRLLQQHLEEDDLRRRLRVRKGDAIVVADVAEAVDRRVSSHEHHRHP